VSVRLDRKYGINAFVNFMRGIWYDDYLVSARVVAAWETEALPIYLQDSRRIGIILAALIFRSYPEFIHFYEQGKEKTIGKRKVLSNDPRAYKSASARLHVDPLHPSENDLLDWCFMSPKESDRSRGHTKNGSMRLFTKKLADFLVYDMEYIRDDHDCAFPQNEDNEEFKKNVFHLAAMFDRYFLKIKQPALVLKTLMAACEQAVNGCILYPEGIMAQSNPKPLPTKIIYFMSNFSNNECKIGKTKGDKNLLERLSSADRFSGKRFKAFFRLRAPEAMEKYLHHRLQYCSVRAGSEIFFLDKVKDFLLTIARSDAVLRLYLPPQEEILKAISEIGPSFPFSEQEP
jgi:hypothetical protein